MGCAAARDEVYARTGRYVVIITDGSIRTGGDFCKAMAAGADGVHLGEQGMPPRAARRVSGGRLLVGRSVHSVEGAMAAEAEGADLLIVGTIFPPASHPGAAGAGVELLVQTRSRVSIPLLAIGGLTPENVESVMEVGASGAAVIGAVAGSADPARACRELMEIMKSAWRSTPNTRVARPG